MEETSELMRIRLAKAEAMRAAGQNPFANDFRVSHTLEDVRLSADATAPDMNSIDEGAVRYRVAGRVLAVNDMGKAAFVRLRDRSSTEANPVFQVYLKKDLLGEDAYDQFKAQVDQGDIVGAVGPVFRTRRGELSILVERFQLLTKAYRPLPDKWHGLTDKETRFRQRYADLIMGLDVREVFRIRAKIVSFIRRFLEDRGYMEVETPMLQAVAGGAAARPFETWHNALGIPLYLRIAPELYLKRLVVGGLERVYELNRNFRNEGMSQKHNPEFTMLEFYQAYATYEDLIALTQVMLSELCVAVHGRDTTEYAGHTISFAAPFARYTVREALTTIAGIDESQTGTLDGLRAAAAERGVHVDPKASYAKTLVFLFEELCEKKLLQPTFITRYPAEISPLSRKSDEDPEWVDRFELFIAGNEVANAFSELNDPVDQKARFEDQVAARAAGDDEAHPIDHDYIRALEYGMPPTAGQGIGIDRIAMLLTGRDSIREVIFFPHMRPEQFQSGTADGAPDSGTSGPTDDQG